MTTTRYYLSRPASGHLAAWGTAPRNPPWGATAATNVHEAKTVPGASSNTYVVTTPTTVARAGRAFVWVTPTSTSPQLVTRIRAAVYAEHWQAGSKALAVAVRHVDPVLPSPTEPPGVEMLFATSAATTTNGYRVYTIDVTLPVPIEVPAGRRLQIDLGGQHAAGGAGGFYVQAGETGADLPFTHGSTTAGRGWIEVTTASPPAPPTGLLQTGATPTTATIGWTPPAGGATPTSYEWRLDAGAPVDVGLSTTATIAGLLPSSPYTVEVRTLTASGPSSWVALEVATTAPSAYRPWLVSDVLLARAGVDVETSQPAFEWQTIAGTEWERDYARSLALMGWTITTGRTGPRDKVPPTVATVTVAAWDDHAGLPLPQLGHRFRLALNPLLTALGIAPADLPRFTGEVTDVSLDTRRRVVTVTAVGRYARESRRTVDGTGWPVEREGARVGRILAAIGATAGTLDAGRVDLLPHPAAATAQQLVDVVSDSTTGQLVERRDGRLDWHDVEHRRDTATLLDLDATDLLAGFTWAQRVGDLTNAVTVRYAGGQEALVTDASSVAERDPYPATLETLLTERRFAQGVAGLIVGRYGRPVWLLPSVMLDLLRTLPATDLGAGLEVAHGSRLHLTGLPAGGPYTQRGVFVEGVTETLTPRAWRLSLTVADEQLAGAPIRWRDVPDAVRWSDARDELRWIDVGTIQDPTALT